MGSHQAPPKHASSPQHLIRMPHPFIMTETPVTRALWREVMGPLKRHLRYARVTPKTKDLPMEQVTWITAIEFCNMLSERVGLSSAYKITKRGKELSVRRDHRSSGYRLPTEAEWEYAARAGALDHQRIYSGGDELENFGWCASNSGKKVRKVKQKYPNEWGFYDMSGGVEELCQDKWSRRHYTLRPSVATNPVIYSSTVIESPQYVKRGGDYQASAAHCTLYHRSFTSGAHGLRLVRPFTQEHDTL
jgi:formylglycine-generating enzyme required for sulfatase activity